VSSGTYSAPYLEVENQLIRDHVDETTAALNEVQYGQAQSRSSFGYWHIDHATPVRRLRSDSARLVHHVELNNSPIRDFVDETAAALNEVPHSQASSRRSLGGWLMDHTPIGRLFLSRSTRTAQTTISEGNSLPDASWRRRDRWADRFRRLARIDSARNLRRRRD
jgi:hypothetical protein